MDINRLEQTVGGHPARFVPQQMRLIEGQNRGWLALRQAYHQLRRQAKHIRGVQQL